MSDEIIWVTETAGAVRWVQETNTRQRLEQCWTIEGKSFTPEGYIMVHEKQEWRVVPVASALADVKKELKDGQTDGLDPARQRRA